MSKLCYTPFLLFLIACQNQESIERIEVSNYEIFRESSSCDTHKDRCFTVAVQLPLITNGPDSFQSSFNQTIENFIIERLTEFAPIDVTEKDIDILIDTIFSDYTLLLEEMEKQNTDIFAVWEIDINGSILLQTESIISVVANSYSNTGGAHPNTQTYYLNFDRFSGKVLTIDDILSHQEPVRKMALDLLKASNRIPEGEDLIEHGFLVNDSDFNLPQNFALTHNGIEFLANPYEISPYAMGAHKILMPFEAIQEFLILEDY